MQLKIDLYIDALKHHDWFYNYSDDHSVWMKGVNTWTYINKLRELYDLDSSMWNEYCPEEFKRLPVNN